MQSFVVYSTQKESTLSGLRGGMQSFVKTLTDKTITLDVEASNNIDNVKARKQLEAGRTFRITTPTGSSELDSAGSQGVIREICPCHGPGASTMVRGP